MMLPFLYKQDNFFISIVIHKIQNILNTQTQNLLLRLCETMLLVRGQKNGEHAYKLKWCVVLLFGNFVSLGPE